MAEGGNSPHLSPCFWLSPACFPLKYPRPGYWCCRGMTFFPPYHPYLPYSLPLPPVSRSAEDFSPLRYGFWCHAGMTLFHRNGFSPLPHTGSGNVLPVPAVKFRCWGGNSAAVSYKRTGYKTGLKVPEDAWQAAANDWTNNWKIRPLLRSDTGNQMQSCQCTGS